MTVPEPGSHAVPNRLGSDAAHEAELRGAFEADGFLVLPEVLSPATVARLREATTHVSGMTRGLLALPEVRDAAKSDAVRRWVELLLGPDAFPVRALYFDKTPAANWPVAWHQDLTIAVRERIDAPGFGAWSVKEGMPHVQAPATVLEGLLAVRLHLDPCGPENGPLRVLPGSHRHGRLSEAEIARWREREPIECHVPAGGAVLMRPLLLHASPRAAAPRRRRVIHIEYAAALLPGELEFTTETQRHRGKRDLAR